MGATTIRDAWSEFVALLQSFESSVSRSKAVNVNAAALRESGAGVVKQFFRVVRPELIQLGLEDHELSNLDGSMQELMALTNGRNAKRSYLRLLETTRKQVNELQVQRELRIGQANIGTVGTGVESRILQTMRDLAPSAALSYEQALLDLGDGARRSYRGPAHELRESLREVLDRLAPDDAVTAASWFVLEKDRTRPTQRQKMRFILESREMSKKARKTPEETVELVDQLTASVARGSYERTSVAAHVGFSRPEVLQLKMYVDSVLSEILEVHAAT